MAKKILIVDDETNIVKLVEARLKSHGYEVVAAFDGQEGLDKVRLENPDLIILDVAMPKLNGLEVCQAIRSDEQYKNIPIVMLTASAQAMDIKKGMEKGADAYVAKPFNPGVLVGIIAGLVGK